MSYKRYSEEFKIEAVKQVTVAGHSVADVAERLGTTTHSLYAWIKRYAPAARIATFIPSQPKPRKSLVFSC